MTAEAIRVIFNADDLGLAPQANEAVRELCEAGVVRSASLLVSGRAAAEAAGMARSLPQLGVGLHLALVHEAPAAAPAIIPALVDSEGMLLPDFRQFMPRCLRGRVPLEQVKAEAEAQLLRMLDWGLRPTHLDSHQHLHLWPPLFSVCVELCRQHGIPFIRLPSPRALLVASHGIPWLRRAQMRWLVRLASRRCLAPDLLHTDGVWGMAAAGHLDEPRLCEIIRRLPPGLHEVMCHPATASCDAATRYPWGYNWAGETAALRSEAVAGLLAEHNITITNYREAADGCPSP